jgi:hypothetical protein
LISGLPIGPVQQIEEAEVDRGALGQAHAVDLDLLS